eukprot:g5832.t1
MEEQSIPDETGVGLAAGTEAALTAAVTDEFDLSPDGSYADDFEESVAEPSIVKEISVTEEPSLVAASSIAESYGDDFEVGSESIAPLSAQNSSVLDEQTVVAEQNGEIVVDSEKSVVSSVVEASDAPAVVNDAPTDVPAAPAEHPQPEAAIEKIASETGVVEDESRAPGTEKTIGAAEADSTLPADTVEVAAEVPVDNGLAQATTIPAEPQASEEPSTMTGDGGAAALPRPSSPSSHEERMEEIEEMKHKMLPYSPSPPSSPQTSRPASPANETEETMRAAAAVRIQNIGRQKSAKKRVDKIRAKRAEAEANVAERAEEVVGGAKMPEEKAAEAVEEETAEPAVETVPETKVGLEPSPTETKVGEKEEVPTADAPPAEGEVAEEKEETVPAVAVDEPVQESYSEKYEESSAQQIEQKIEPVTELLPTEEEASVAPAATDAERIEEMRVTSRQDMEEDPMVPIALDDSKHKSPYELLMSKSSKKNAKALRRSSHGLLRSKKGNRGGRMVGSRSAASVQVDSDGFVTVEKSSSVSAIHRAPLVQVSPVSETVEGESSRVVTAQHSPVFERVVEMRASISSIKDRFKALKQISMLDEEIALEGGWTEKDIKEELVKLKKELAREREKLKVTLQNGSHRLGGKTAPGGSSLSQSSFAPNASTASSASSSKVRDRLFSDKVADKLQKLCSNLDRQCKRHARELAAEKRGWVKPLNNPKLSPVLRHYKPTFEKNPVAPLFRGSATDPTGGREIGFVPRRFESLDSMRSRYRSLESQTKSAPREDIDDEILQEMWALEVSMAEAKRQPRYKAQGKSLKKRILREYEPVRRRTNRQAKR